MTSNLIFPVALLIILGLGSGVVILGLVNAFANSSDMGDRIQNFAYIPDSTSQRRDTRRRDRFLRLRLRFNRMFSAIATDDLNLKLLSANWPISPTEFVMLRISLTLLGLAAGWFTFQFFLPGVGLAILAYIGMGIYFHTSIRQRRAKFERQLVDVLVLATGAVRSGYSFLQALDVVVNEMQAPASEEFGRVRREVGLGLPLSEALQNLTDRMQNDDLYLAVTAIIINSQVGGNLTTMLEAVTITIRERIQLFSEIRSLTSQQRYTAYLLTLLPFMVGAFLFVVNPEYMSRITEVICIPIGAIFNILLGNLIIQRMMKFRV
jgi:tight adherence protein B